MKKFRLRHTLLSSASALLTTTVCLTAASCSKKNEPLKPKKTDIKINSTLSKEFDKIYNNFTSWTFTAPQKRNTFAYYLNSPTSANANKTQYQQFRVDALSAFGFTGNSAQTDFNAVVNKSVDAIKNLGGWSKNKADFEAIMRNDVQNYFTFLFILMLCYDKQRSTTASTAQAIPFSSTGLWGGYLDYISDNSSLNLAPDPQYNLLNLNTIGNLNQKIALLFNKPKEATGTLKDIFVNNALLANFKKDPTLTFNNLSANEQYAPTNPSPSNPSRSIVPYNYTFTIDFHFKTNNHLVNFDTYFVNSQRSDDRLPNRLLYLMSNIY